MNEHDQSRRSVGDGLPAVAQNVNANNLVNVNISGVAVQSADLIHVRDITVRDIQALNNIQVSIGVAADVCPSVNVGALAQEFAQDATTECTAENASRPLTQAVQRELQ